jgi:DNA mismatch endonuclease, patch repair protein
MSQLVECLICGRKMKSLSPHHRVHGITCDEYKIRFPGALLMSKDTWDKVAKKGGATVEHKKIPQENLISCMVCGKFLRTIQLAHVRMHSMTVTQYKEKFPGAPILCETTRLKQVEQGQARVFDEEHRGRLRDARLKQLEKPDVREAFLAMTQSDWMRKIVSDSSNKRWSNPDNCKAQSDLMTGLHQNPEFRAKHQASMARVYLTQSSGLNDRVADLLTSFGVDFKREFLFGYWSYDFAFPEVQVLFEVHGCYWHGCVKCMKTITKQQRNQQKQDKAKSTYAKNHGWTLVIIWEHDVPKKFQKEVA